MTQLSRLATLGIAKETTAGTYVAPTAGIPWDKAGFEDVVAPLRDESVRGNDTLLQGLYPGPAHATWDIDVMAYPDLSGYFLAGIIGPDSVTAGVSTTLSSATLVGATSITTAATITTGTTIMIGSGDSVDYAVTGTPSGAGPYTIPLTSPTGGLLYPHASSDPVVGQSTHTFKQSTAALPTYSLTVFDTTQTLGYTGLKWTDLQVKIDPKAAVSLNIKGLAQPSAVQSSASETYTVFAPQLGWAWTQQQDAVTTSRGLTLDVTVKRAGEAINSSDGTQAPREIFTGALECDGTYKAIFENQTDMNVFLNYTQQSVVATVTQPIGLGAQSLALTMSKGGWTTGKRDLGQPYAQADFAISGIYNATDGGAVQATLKNFRSTAY